MNWRIKVAAFKALSALPGGSAAYRFLQERVTRSLDPTPQRVGQKLDVGTLYFKALTELGCADLLLRGTHLDFGTGWHPSIPFLYYSMGTPRQELFDLVPALSRETVAATVRTFLDLIKRPDCPHTSQLSRLPPPEVGPDWRKYLADLGITYSAPYADVFPSLDGKIDVVTSTQVLLHIPREPMRWCFGEIYRSLKPGGLFLATIHLKDLWASIHIGLSKYNHLRYSPAAWERWVNSPLMSFNRFKAPDYRQLLEETKFEIVRFDVEPGTKEDLAELDTIPIADCFKRYSREDLAAHHLFFAARKPRS
jgi:SAM-dependent methyltransferase